MKNVKPHMKLLGQTTRALLLGAGALYAAHTPAKEADACFNCEWDSVNNIVYCSYVAGQGEGYDSCYTVSPHTCQFGLPGCTPGS
jgi:hypothetical protein